MNSTIGRVAISIVIIVFTVGFIYAAEQEGAGPLPPPESQGTGTVPEQPGTPPEKILIEGARVTQVLGKAVINTKGEQLGRVHDLILSRDGCLEYIILGHGGLLGIGDRLVPIPWKSVQTGAKSDVLIVSADKDGLEKAPSFETKRWPDFGSPELKKKIFEYFGIKSGEAEGTK